MALPMYNGHGSAPPAMFSYGNGSPARPITQANGPAPTFLQPTYAQMPNNNYDNTDIPLANPVYVHQQGTRPLYSQQVQYPQQQQQNLYGQQHFFYGQQQRSEYQGGYMPNGPNSNVVYSSNIPQQQGMYRNQQRQCNGGMYQTNQNNQLYPNQNRTGGRQQTKSDEEAACCAATSALCTALCCCALLGAGGGN